MLLSGVVRPEGGEVHPASATAASATAPVIARPPVMSRPIWCLCCLCGEQCIRYKRTKQPALTPPSSLTPATMTTWLNVPELFNSWADAGLSRRFYRPDALSESPGADQHRRT